VDLVRPVRRQIGGAPRGRPDQNDPVVTTHQPRVPLPRRFAAVTVRQGGLDDDLDALNRGNPMWWGKDFVAERIATSPPEDPWYIMVAEVDDAPLGSAFLLAKGVTAAGRAAADVYVLPEARRRGVGRAMFETLVDETRAHGLPGVKAEMPDDDPASLATAVSWGCAQVGHHRESVLDLAAVDDTLVTSLQAKPASAGITLEPLPDHADEAAWREIYDMQRPVWADAPDADGASDQMPFSVWRGFFPDPSYVLVARRDGTAVAANMLMDRPKDDALNILFIAVMREARGLGLSAALMARHAQLMRDAGHHRLYTQNMDQNVRILRSNERVGFRVASGYLDVAFDLAADRSAR
jgi:GNAT superfamily N-acetyltransferase